MKNISKEKITGIVGTVVFHLLLVLLLLFIVMDQPPMEPEAGLSVVMGNEYAMTEVEVAPQPPKPQAQPKPQEPKPEKPLITQNDEESVNLDSAKSAEREKEKMLTKLQEEERKQREEEEALKKATNLMANAFGKGSSMGSKGNDKVDEGTNGAPEGTMDTGEKEGSGIGSFDLAGRSLTGDGKLPLPAYNVQEEGRVVVTITVDPDGNIIGTRINGRTNTTSQALRNAAISAAKRARFNAIGGVNNQEGTITYYFRLK